MKPKTTQAATDDKDERQYWREEDTLNGRKFEDILKTIGSMSKNFSSYRKELNDKLSPERFLKILKEAEEIHVLLSSLNSYCTLKTSANTTDVDALAKASQLKQVDVKSSNDMMFFTLWTMHLDDKTAKKYLDYEGLSKYKYYIEEVRKLKKYTKSEDIEQLLNIKDTTGLSSFSEIYNILTSAFTYDFHGKKVTEEELRANLTSNDPARREEACKALLGKYQDNNTVFSEIYKDIALEWYNDGVKIRGYKNSMNVRNVSNDISDKAVDTLLSVVQKNVKVFHEYFKLKYDINKKNGAIYPYSRYHIYAPFPQKLTRTYSYNESRKIVLDTYKSFDERFYKNAVKIFDSGHIHSHPVENKSSGAFCAPIHTKIVPYVMLNHTGRLRDVYTMVHELGHAIHTLFASNCADLTFHASIPVAETASVFSEMLLTEKLLKESKDNTEKQYVLLYQLDNQYATIIKQVYVVLFEKFAHEKIIEGVSKDDLNSEHYKLIKEQFGNMEIPEDYRNEWMVISHVFEYPFYCYAYAWGNLLVLALYDMYKSEGKKFIKKYIQLLSAGGSRSPMTLLKELGINPESEEFWQRGFNIIKKEIEELKKLAK